MQGDAEEPDKCFFATQNLKRGHKEEGVKTFMIHADIEILEKFYPKKDVTHSAASGCSPGLKRTGKQAV